MLAKLANKVGGLAVAFDGAPPTRVTYDVEDRGVDIGVAEGFSFFGGDFSDTADEIFVPSGPDSDLSREVTGVAMACLLYTSPSPRDRG